MSFAFGSVLVVFAENSKFSFFSFALDLLALFVGLLDFAGWQVEGCISETGPCLDFSKVLDITFAIRSIHD